MAIKLLDGRGKIRLLLLFLSRTLRLLLKLRGGRRVEPTIRGWHQRRC